MITKEYHEEIITDVHKFNLFMKEYTEILIRRVYLEVPEMVIKHIQTAHRVTKLKETLYKDNPELVAHKELVMQTANTIQGEHPDWEMEELFNEAILKVKEKLMQEVDNG